MDAFNLLKTDHRRVAERFKLLERTSGKRKLHIFEQIKTELDLHAHIEEKVFYPALEKSTATRDVILEAYEEHAQVKKLLRELSRSKTADDEWQAKVKVLQENVEHHVQEEENELFKKARTVLSAEEIEELGERLEAEKARKEGGTVANISAGKSSAKVSGARKSAPAKKAAGKKQPAKKAAKKTSGSKKSARSKSARAAK